MNQKLAMNGRIGRNSGEPSKGHGADTNSPECKLLPKSALKYFPTLEFRCQVLNTTILFPRTIYNYRLSNQVLEFALANIDYMAQLFRCIIKACRDSHLLNVAVVTFYIAIFQLCLWKS